MSVEMPAVPSGNGKHPIPLVVISANSLAASGAFYSTVFGWQTYALSPELTAVVVPAGPGVALRSGTPGGFPGVVPFIGVPDVNAALAQVVAAGATVERATWTVPQVGTMARFTDASETIYGLTSALVPGGIPRVPMPFGSNPKPVVGSICSLEMYADEGARAARFFSEQFGWGTLPTMPQYVAFDPGAGIGGVFQSHTSATKAVAYIYVADVGATVSAIEAAGGTRQGDPMPVPGMGCFGYFSDPSGTSMGLIGP